MAASNDDLLGRLRALLREQAGVGDDLLARIEAQLRQEFGGREVYVHKRAKRARLERLGTLSPDAPPRERTVALGLSDRHARRLWSLLRR